MYSIASGASADDDNVVARFCVAGYFVDGHFADAAAVDEWISDVAIVEGDGSVEGGDSHAVGVVADAGDDLGEYSTRMQAACGDIFEVGVRDAEDVGGGEWFCGESGSDDVADAPSDSGGGAAVGFEGRGVVVCFDFEADGGVFVEFDDACVIDEDGEEPLVESVVHEFEGGGGDG